MSRRPAARRGRRAASPRPSTGAATPRVQALQQAMVRMMVDPAFCARVYAGGDCGLDPADRALLQRVDRRAWSTDRYRRGRLVQALLDEYPATAAVIGVAGVDAFFGSEAFAACLARRGSMAVDFGAWAAGAGGGAVAQLEGAMARARRWRPLPGAGIQPGPGVVPATLPGGTVAALQAARSALGAEPLAALAAGTRVPAPVLDPEAPAEALLVRCDAAGALGLSPVGAGLCAVVAAVAAAPLAPGPLLGRIRRLGARADEARALLDELLADGTLAQSPAPWPALRLAP